MCTKFGLGREGLVVGWYQREGECALGDSSYVQVAQTAVAFDLGLLDEVPRKSLLSAALHFDEQPVEWTSGAGQPELKEGCVVVLGIATSDWASQPNTGNPFPNDSYNDVYGLNAPPHPRREWDVTGHVRQQLQNADNASLRFGYVLRGSDENPQGEDSASCLSEVSKIHLRVSYLIPSS